MAAPRKPQDRRPSLAKKHTRKTTENADHALEQGLAVTDDDGTRLNVRIRDVKGIHDARLVEETGMDFMMLLDAMTQRQGLDLFATALWFCRLVNGREPESREAILERFGYEDFIQLDTGEPKAEDDAPKASDSSS